MIPNQCRLRGSAVLKSMTFVRFAMLLILAIAPSLAAAQATRTWVSGVGDDANPCSRTAPCKTFAGAISKTAAGGIINALDPGGFGAVTITKSIEIEAVGTVAGVLVSGTNGIIVNAASTDTVVLRGISLDGIGTGLNAIRLLSAGKLIVENTTIDNFTQNGVDIEPSVNAKVLLHNVTVNKAGNAAVFVSPTGGATAAVAMDTVNLSNSTYGLYVASGKASLRNSVLSANSNSGINSVGSTSMVRINVDNTLVSDNASFGIRSTGAQSFVYVSNSSITGNGLGLSLFASGSLISYGNNRVFENSTNGIFTSTLNEQ